MEDEKKSKVCRVCLNVDSELKCYDLFDKTNSTTLADKINAIADVKIKEGDNFPKQICSGCLAELDKAYSFKLKCENSNGILLTSVTVEVCPQSQQKTVIKEEEQEDFEYDYLDEDELTVSEYLVKNEPSESKDNLDSAEVKTENVRKSRAIDLRLECHDCGGLFKSKCKLSVHWRREHMKALLICKFCKRKFKSFSAFNKHMKNRTQSCLTAEKVNIEGEGRSRVFHCVECSYKSARIKDMSSHIVVHTGERPYQCDECDRTFTQASSLQAHKESLHNASYKEGTCDICGKHIKGRSKLYRHMKKHKYTPFPCKICNKILRSSYTLKDHMKRHSGVKAYSCEICPSRFFTYGELYNHKSKVHDKIKQYECHMCAYKSYHHSRMRQHKSRHTHDNVACDFCGMFLDNEQQLELHKKRHFEKNLKCPQCEMKFFSKKNLSTHLRKKHKIVKAIGTNTKSKSNNVKFEIVFDGSPIS